MLNEMHGHPLNYPYPILISKIPSCFMIRLLKPLRGSTSNDFNELRAIDENPLPDCPHSPNCVKISKQIACPDIKLYKSSVHLIKKMKAYRITEYEEILYIEAVFRIRLFGFLDDFLVRITKGHNENSSILHIRSASRTGYCDLGVNRRRAGRFIDQLERL